MIWVNHSSVQWSRRELAYLMDFTLYFNDCDIYFPILWRWFTFSSSSSSLSYGSVLNISGFSSNLNDFSESILLHPWLLLCSILSLSGIITFKSESSPLIYWIYFELFIVWSFLVVFYFFQREILNYYTSLSGVSIPREEMEE